MVTGKYPFTGLGKGPYPPLGRQKVPAHSQFGSLLHPVESNGKVEYLSHPPVTGLGLYPPLGRQKVPAHSQFGSLMHPVESNGKVEYLSHPITEIWLDPSRG